MLGYAVRDAHFSTWSISAAARLLVLRAYDLGATDEAERAVYSLVRDLRVRGCKEAIESLQELQ